MCFSCGGTIRQELINHSSDPNNLHCKFYPNCDFLRQNKGERFIREVQDHLTDEERAMVCSPIPNSTSLYSSPVSEIDIHRDRVNDQRDLDRFYILEGRIPGVSHEEIRRNMQLTEQRSQQPQQHILNGERFYDGRINDAVLNDCTTILETLRSQFPSETLYALERLVRKVTEARYKQSTLRQNLREVLQKLASCPEAERQTVAGEIMEIINTVQDQDCQDHTAEVIDQIKTRLLFMTVKQELLSEQAPSLTQFFCKLKLFFNESVLYKVLACTLDSNKIPLIASRESTEVRAYLKNYLSREVCQFPAGPIVQRYSTIGQPSPQMMDRIVDAFKRGINNQVDFVGYLTDLCRTDCQFMDLLKSLDTNLSIQLAKSESNAELLMENFDPLMEPGASSNQIYDGAGNVAHTREQWTREDLELFFEEQVRSCWELITNG